MKNIKVEIRKVDLEEDINPYDPNSIDGLVEKILSKNASQEDWVNAFAYSSLIDDDNGMYDHIIKTANITTPEDEDEDNFASLLTEFIEEEVGWENGMKLPPFSLEYEGDTIYSYDELVSKGVCFSKSDYNEFLQDTARKITERYIQFSEDN